jgi:hypothetical protein
LEILIACVIVRVINKMSDPIWMLVRSHLCYLLLKNYSLIRSLGLVARPVQSKSKVEMRLQSRFRLSAEAHLNIFGLAVPLSFSPLLSASKQG